MAGIDIILKVLCLNATCDNTAVSFPNIYTSDSISDELSITVKGIQKKKKILRIL